MPSVRKAEQLLDELGISSEGERQAYYSDEEYAAALLGTNPAEIDLLLLDASQQMDAGNIDGCISMPDLASSAVRVVLGTIFTAPVDDRSDHVPITASQPRADARIPDART